MILLSGPAIAKLNLRTRKWAHDHLRRGSFGAVTVVNGVLYADVRGVERTIGTTFTDAQLALASDGHRLIVLHDHHDEGEAA